MVKFFTLYIIDKEKKGTIMRKKIIILGIIVDILDIIALIKLYKGHKEIENK